MYEEQVTRLQIEVELQCIFQIKNKIEDSDCFFKITDFFSVGFFFFLKYVVKFLTSVSFATTHYLSSVPNMTFIFIFDNFEVLNGGFGNN